MVQLDKYIDDPPALFQGNLNKTQWILSAFRRQGRRVSGKVKSPATYGYHLVFQAQRDFSLAHTTAIYVGENQKLMFKNTSIICQTPFNAREAILIGKKERKELKNLQILKYFPSECDGFDKVICKFGGSFLRYFIFLFLFIFSFVSKAQNATEIIKKVNPIKPLLMKQDRFRVGLAYNTFNFDSIYLGGASLNNNFMLSYLHTRPNDLGFLIRGNHTDYKSSGNNVGSLFRLETNATYAFSNYFYVFGGINIGLYSGKIKSKISTSELGTQIGLGADIFSNIGFEFSYIQNAGRVSKDPSSKKTLIPGYELAVVVGF